MNEASIPALLALFLCACGGAPAAPVDDDLPLGRAGTLPVDEIRARVKEPAQHTAFVPERPLGLVADLAATIPANNPLTPLKVELGRQLFFDARLSQDGRVACASCHHPSAAWAGHARIPRGAGGAQGARNAPALANRALGATQAWDGRATTLEEQVLTMLASPTQMGSAPADAAARLEAIEGYHLEFDSVFGGPATPERIAKALAAFLRTILAGASKNDLYERALPMLAGLLSEGETDACLESMQAALGAAVLQRMSDAALRGRALFFGAARCNACHGGENLSDERYHVVGPALDAHERASKGLDLGRFLVTKNEAERGAFRTPSLRDVARSAPYLHDGSQATLRAALDFHAATSAADSVAADAVALGLGEQEKQDLVAFLEDGLTSTTLTVELPRLP